MQERLEASHESLTQHATGHLIAGSWPQNFKTMPPAAKQDANILPDAIIDQQPDAQQPNGTCTSRQTCPGASRPSRYQHEAI